MAVTILDAWQGQTAGDPDGSLTISSGSDRLLVIVYFVERAATFTYSSMTVGTVAATGELIEEAANGETYIWTWFWDEAAIASMSGTTVAFAKSAVPTKEDWDYAVYQGAAGGAEFGTSVDEAATDTLDITTASTTTADDFIFTFNNREASSRDIQDFDNLTQVWQFNDTGNYTLAIAAGAGGDDTVNMVGDGINGQWFAQILHAKSSGGGTALPLLGGASSSGGF